MLCAYTNSKDSETSLRIYIVCLGPLLFAYNMYWLRGLRIRKITSSWNVHINRFAVCRYAKYHFSDADHIRMSRERRWNYFLKLLWLSSDPLFFSTTQDETGAVRWLFIRYKLVGKVDNAMHSWLLLTTHSKHTQTLLQTYTFTYISVTQ